MKILYIHAGLPKNGSSALQVFFAKNQKNLLQSGIEYLKIGNTQDIEEAKQGHITSGNGALLSRSMLNIKHEAYYEDNGKLYREMLDMVKTSKVYMGLISSEFFALLPLNTMQNWKDDLALLGVTLKFIFYARRQDQFLMSGYMQRVKRHGYIGNPNDYLLDKFRSIHFLNYFGYFSEIETLLGKDNLLVDIYESTKTHPKGLIGHFMQSILGQCPEWVKTDPTINTSPSPLEIKLMLISNKYSPRMQFSDFIVQDSIITGRSSKFKVHNIVSSEVVQIIMDYFQDQNHQFEEKYCSGKTFPLRSNITKEYVDIDNLSFSSSEVMDIISGFIVRLDRRVAELEK